MSETLTREPTTEQIEAWYETTMVLPAWAYVAMREQIASAPHDDHCFTNDPNPEACRCVCGKDSLLWQLDHLEERFPVPAPPFVTP